MEPIYISLDLETTGLDVGRDEIIEVGAQKFRGVEVLETFQTFVRPRQFLPIKITRLTGISPSDVVTAPTFNDVGGRLAQFIKSYPIVGHSIDGDLRFLAQQGLRVSQTAYDTFELAALLVPQLPNYSLATLASHFKIPHPDAHRALADADVTRLVFLELLDLLSALSVGEIHEIAERTQALDWPIATLFRDLAKRRVKTLWTAPTVAKPTATGRPTPLEPTGNIEPLDYATVASFFSPDGVLSQAFPGYEPRPQQAEMAHAVATTLNEGETLLVEAGTGTGKSLAYLVPSALFALQRGERVVVSTNTINLQDQLAIKDVPALQQILQTFDPSLPPLQAVQLKGRGNYLCLKRYETLRGKHQHTANETKALIKMQLWIPGTQSGDRAELMLLRDETPVWSEVNVNPDMCLRQRCPLYNECFYFKARAEAEAAHIVIANHALLLSDIRSPGILPRYDHVVIDEAHNLEDVATDQLGFTLSQSEFFAFLDELHQTGGPRIVQGLLSEWQAAFRLSTVNPKDRQRLEDLSAELQPKVDKAREAGGEWFRALRAVMEHDRSVTQYDPRLRITSKVRRHEDWQAVEQAWENLSLTMQAVADGIERFQFILEPLDQRDISDFVGLLGRVKNLVVLADTIQERGDSMVFGDDTLVAWLNVNQRDDELSFSAAPLDVGPMLNEKLWSHKRAAVLASATLSINHTFDYARVRLGLEEPAELHLDSPFDYTKSTLLYLPTDMPEPNEKNYQRVLEDTLIALGKATKGRLLALFTANQAMRQTYHGIQEGLEQAEITTMAQGLDGSRRSLIDRFKADSRTVLLGTTSFWEGVDVVGDALSVLAITKLPFSVPNDPVFSARSEAFEDAFNEYAVPQAILRFKQGFGRLIRSHGDRGIVVILDRRLLSKRYGQTFINSLPDCTLARRPLKDLPRMAEKWLEQG